MCRCFVFCDEPPVEQHREALLGRLDRPVELRREIVEPIRSAATSSSPRRSRAYASKPLICGGLPGRQMPNGLMPTFTHGFAACTPL